MSATLTYGTNTMAPAAWSDATGFADDAELSVSTKFARITAGLGQGSHSIESLDFLPGSEGIVGGGDYGSLTFDATSSADARVTNLGKVKAYMAAATKVNNVHTGHARALSALTAGEWEIASIEAGKQVLGESATSDRWIALGGQSVISSHASSVLGLGQFIRGVSALHRKTTLIEVGQDAVLHLDPDSGIDWTSCAVKLYGGTILWYGGAIPAIEGIGGLIDFRVAREPIAGGLSGLGSDSFDVAGCTVLGSDLVELDNLTRVGAILRDGSAPINYTPPPMPIG